MSKINYPENYRMVTVKEDTVTERVFAGMNRDYNGITMKKGKVYLVEPNNSFGSGVFDLYVRGSLESNLFLKIQTDVMVSSDDVVFLDGKEK